MKTTEQLAEERYPYSMQRLLWSKTDKGRHEHAVDLQRLAHATCIREEVKPLEAWKESAIKVMGEWDKVHEALGKPGNLGESIAAASLSEVARLRALVQELTTTGDLIRNQLVNDGRTNARAFLGRVMNNKQDTMWDIAAQVDITVQNCVEAWDATKQAGFVPTNTEDNG